MMIENENRERQRGRSLTPSLRPAAGPGDSSSHRPHVVESPRNNGSVHGRLSHGATARAVRAGAVTATVRAPGTSGAGGPRLQVRAVVEPTSRAGSAVNLFLTQSLV